MTPTTTRTDPEFRTENASGEYDVGTKSEVNGAAVAGGLAGLLLAGPFVGAMAAASAAYVAANKKGDAGDFCRKSGTVATDVGKSLLKIEKENKILDQISEELVKGAGWVEKRMNSTKSKQTLETEANLTS